MDPLHMCIALGPLAMYLLVLGSINLAPRPTVTSGGRDTFALGLAISGFVVAGPMELFLPERSLAFLGAGAWGLMLAAYGLLIVLIILLQRPRIVLYNCTAEQLRQALTAVIRRLDPAAQWTGENLASEALGVHLHVEVVPVLKNVQLVSVGPEQHLAAWRAIERELATELRASAGTPNPYGISLLSFGLLMCGIVTY
ncbi:MAG: hypothetical protein SFU86_22525, partial [Pirellulaceae bacterium]|nr:hypothetical protein [Pirellulaceae bacterium]